MSEQSTATATARHRGTTQATAAKKEKKGAARRRGPGAWYLIRDGRSMSLTFFKRNGWLILPAMVAVIWLIGQRYSNQSRMERIKILKEELRRAESEKLDAKAEYMSLIRESEMRRLMREKGLNLDYQERPPYILTK